MAKNYIKLDLDWDSDPKVMDYESRYGKAALVDVVRLFCAMGEFFGRIDLADNGQRLKLQARLKKKGRALDSFLERCAGCGIVSPEALHALRVVCSDRSLRDGEARLRRRESAAAASDASARARARAGGTATGTVTDAVADGGAGTVTDTVTDEKNASHIRERERVREKRGDYPGRDSAPAGTPAACGTAAR